ncbi:unnamed protein product [Lampetra planeri]
METEDKCWKGGEDRRVPFPTSRMVARSDSLPLPFSSGAAASSRSLAQGQSQPSDRQAASRWHRRQQSNVDQRPWLPWHGSCQPAVYITDSRAAPVNAPSCPAEAASHVFRHASLGPTALTVEQRWKTSMAVESSAMQAGSLRPT